MAMPPIASVRGRMNPAVWLAVPLVSTLICAAGIAGLLSRPLSLALGAGLTALGATVVLVRTALRIHHADDAFAACRGAGFIGCGAAAAGLTAALPALHLPSFGVTGLIGVCVTAALYMLGTLLLPGAATSAPVRLRRIYDGVGLGVSLGFAAYLITPMPNTPGMSLAVTMVAAGAISVITVVVLRARLHRTAALRCAAGAITVLIALCVEVNFVNAHNSDIALPILGLFVIAGLTLSAEGASRREPLPQIEAPEPEQYLSSYPLLAVPASVGVVAAIYHLVRFHHHFDARAIVLGITMVAVLMTRELLIVRDIRTYADQLAEKEAHFRSLVAGATDLTLVLDERLTIGWQSPAAARVFGLADSAVVGRSFAELIHPEDVAGAEAVIASVLAGELADGPPALVQARFSDGQGVWRDTESTVSDQRAVPEVAALVVHVRDVGERKQLERTLHALSYTDQLTGLPNRRSLMRDLLAYRRRAGQQGTVLVIDLHGLDEINEEHGRETGDTVLVEVARRIRGLVSDGEVPARLGGDEFAVLTGDGAVFTYALATRLVTRLMEPYELPGVVAEVHTSVGLAEVSGGADSDEVLRHADLARKRSCQLGPDRVEWYDPDVEVQLHRRMDLEQELLSAVDRGELDVVFQPVVDLRDRRPVGVEALLRWRHPKLGTILPAEILPIARDVGVAADLDEWVLDAACRHLSNWFSADETFWLSVNTAPRELLSARFPEQLMATLEKHDVSPERLVVEVAEEWIAADVPAIVAALAGLRKLGVRAALDDFGAGQASLSHLRRLPVDQLKLDRGLMNALPHRTGPAVLDVVVSLGRRLGLEVVAKGLETEDDVDRARAAGCVYGQGFALARPAPAERTEAYLDSHRADAH